MYIVNDILGRGVLSDTSRLFLFGVYMNISDVVSMIGSIGFPIVACCAMAWFIATTFRNFNDLVTKNNVLTEELIGLLQKGDGDEDTSRVA